MSNYGGNQDNDRLRLVQQRADDVADIARQNIAMSIAQVDKLQDMEEKASRLEDSSSSFQRGASRVRRKMCVRSYKMLALIIFLVLVLLVIIIVPIVCKSTSC